MSIARALIANPEVLMLDEPTGNLDIDTATEVMKYIEAINEQGATIIMATHHMFNWGTKPKKIIRLKDGRVVKKEYV